jgi:hypothetical protein
VDAALAETGGAVAILLNVDEEHAERADARGDDADGKLNVFAINHR